MSEVQESYTCHPHIDRAVLQVKKIYSPVKFKNYWNVDYSSI